MDRTLRVRYGALRAPHGAGWLVKGAAKAPGR